MRRSGIKIMGKLIRLIKPLIPTMFAAIVMGVSGFLCAIFITITAVAAGLKIIGMPVSIFSAFTLRGMFVTMALMAVFRGVLHYAEHYCNHYIAFKLLAVLRHKVFAALCRLAPAKLEGRDRGELISVITSDIELLEVFYAHTVSPVAIAVITGIFMAGFIGSFNVMCGILAVLGYLVIGAAIPLVNGRIGKQPGMKYNKAFGRMNGFVLDSFRGIEESIQYANTYAVEDEFEIRTEGLFLEHMKLTLLSGTSSGAAGICISIFSFAMLFLSFYLFSEDRLGFQEAVIVTTAMMGSFGPAVALSNLSNSLNKTLASGERVLALLEETPETEEIIGCEKIGFCSAGFKNVSFSYKDKSAGSKISGDNTLYNKSADSKLPGHNTVSDKILENVNLHIKENEILGIHGKSGSGKSTMLKLLMRFWDADAGRVEISERDIRHINTSDLHEIEGFVTQETVLFHDTIAGNITLGKSGACSEKIIEAAKKASIHDFIVSLPDGYDTMVSELGESLSGGQRQRIGLARAFFHDAPFLLLDEPTANLDSLNEGIILKALHDERHMRTVILVSHRKSTLNIADRIYEFDQINAAGG